MATPKTQRVTYAKRLKAIQEVSRTIVSDLYLDEILRLIVAIIARVMDSKICSLMLLDEKKEELIVRATQSVSEAYNKKSYLFSHLRTL